jgi:hypothetical protein
LAKPGVLAVFPQHPAQRVLSGAVDRLVHSHSTELPSEYPKIGYSLDA